MREPRTMAKTDALTMLRLAGIDPDTVRRLDQELPDRIDFDRDGALLQSYGITRDTLISQRGGSP